MMSNQFSSDILYTKCKAKELNLSQGIYFLKCSFSILHPRIKNSSQICKLLEFRRLLDILSLLDNQGMMSSQFSSDIIYTKCKALELRPSQDICFLKGSFSILHHQLKNSSLLCKH